MIESLKCVNIQLKIGKENDIFATKWEEYT